GQFGMTNLSYDSSRNIDNWKFYVKENYSSNGGYSGRNYLAYFVTKSFNKPTTFYISVGKLEKGTKATDWTPAPEDTDAKITSNTTLIEQNADGLKLKANQDTVDTLAGTVQSLGTEFDIVAGQVNSRVWNTDIESAIDGIEVGGRNLIIRNTETPDKWIALSGELDTAPNHDTSDYIKVEPNTDYMLTKSNSELAKDAGFFRWAWYDVDMDYIDRRANSNNKILWKTPNDVHYVRVSYPTDSS